VFLTWCMCTFTKIIRRLSGSFVIFKCPYWCNIRTCNSSYIARRGSLYFVNSLYFRFKSPSSRAVEDSWNVMAHAQKPNFFFRRNGRVYLNRRRRQFSRLLATEVCASAVVMLDTPCSVIVWRLLAIHSIHQFPLHFPSRVSPCAFTFQLESTWNLNPTVVGGFSTFVPGVVIGKRTDHWLDYHILIESKPSIISFATAFGPALGHSSIYPEPFVGGKLAGSLYWKFTFIICRH